MKNAQKEKIPQKREMKLIIEQAYTVRQALVDQGRTDLPEYASLCHNLDMYELGVKCLKPHITRAIHDILKREDLQHIFGQVPHSENSPEDGK